MMWIMIVYIFLITNLSFVQSGHFLGGTISWKTLNNKDISSSISVMFIQSYQWKASATACNQSIIYNLASVPLQSDLLMCVSNSTLCGGFSSLDTKGYCIDSSVSLDSRSTQILDVENITANSKFCVAFQSIYWGIIQSQSCSFICNTNTSKWSIGSCVDLTIRPEGFINTPPVATIVSPIRVPANSVTNITIPVIDADNDIIRCRWAQNTSTFDECGDICGVIPGSTLDSNDCTLTFNSTGKSIGDYYAVALMAEDFFDPSMHTSLSSIPIQFLIEIGNASSCLTKPTINSNVSDCTAIQVGIQFNFTLTITQGCPTTTIDELFTTPPLYMDTNSLIRNGTGNTWDITQTWIPTVQQLGSQVYCAVAIDSDGIQSDQYCLTFNVVSVGQALLCPSQTTTTTIATRKSLTAAARTAIETVVVPDTSSPNYRFTNFDLALALGLSIPLVLICVGLILFKCCCKQCKSISSIFSRQKNTGTTTGNNNHTESTQQVINATEENKDVQIPLSDYQQQYVNDGQKPHTNNLTKMSNKTRPLTVKNSLASMPITDFEQNSINTTKTTFLSPSMRSLATNNMQFSTDYSLENAKSTNHGSVLVRAYCHQENEKAILQETLS